VSVVRARRPTAKLVAEDGEVIAPTRGGARSVDAAVERRV
jgi:hypothetical protein